MQHRRTIVTRIRGVTGLKSLDRRTILRSAALLLAASLLIAGMAIVWFMESHETILRRQIGEAEKVRNWIEASSLWDRYELEYPENLTSEDFVRRARCELVLNRPATAQKMLDRWKSFDRRDPSGWQISVELRRALGDMDGVNRQIREALRDADARRLPSFLTVSTFGLLTVMDPAESRSRLERWAKTEPDSPLSRTWLIQRSLEEVDATGQLGAETLQQARELAKKWPGDSEIRRVLVEALFVQGDYESIRQEMKQWPADDSRDAVGWLRLEGRRLLEIEKDAAGAVPLFESVLTRMPQDWRSRYRLSRALAGAGRAAEARKEATRTVEIRELLEPASLEPVLKEAFPRGKPPNPVKLIVFLQKIEQVELAQAWQDWRVAEKLFESLR